VISPGQVVKLNQRVVARRKVVNASFHSLAIFREIEWVKRYRNVSGLVLWWIPQNITNTPPRNMNKHSTIVIIIMKICDFGTISKDRSHNSKKRKQNVGRDIMIQTIPKTKYRISGLVFRGLFD
jgi:hypothetical protein